MEEPIKVKPDDMQFDVSRPRFSWTQNSEEHDVRGGRDEQTLLPGQPNTTRTCSPLSNSSKKLERRSTAGSSGPK